MIKHNLQYATLRKHVGEVEDNLFQTFKYICTFTEVDQL